MAWTAPQLEQNRAPATISASQLEQRDVCRSRPHEKQKRAPSGCPEAPQLEHVVTAVPPVPRAGALLDSMPHPGRLRWKDERSLWSATARSGAGRRAAAGPYGSGTYGQQPYGPPPTARRIPPGGAPTDEQRNWAVAAHIGALVTAWFAFGFLAPLLVMLVKPNDPFVRRHAVESLNFQISLLIYSVVGTVVTLVIALLTLGIGLLVLIPVILVILVLALVAIIQATMRASRGEDFRYPLTLRFVS